MWRKEEVKESLGPTGIAFVFALLVFIVCYLTGSNLLLLLDLLALIPLTFITVFRAFRFITKHSLWSLRNRLLFVYALFGFVPVVLLFILFGLVTWSFMSELAIYLATTALNARVDAVESALKYTKGIPEKDRRYACPGIQKAFAAGSPGFMIYLHDGTGSHRWPESSPDFTVPTAWGNVHGLLVYNRQFYGWAHYRDAAQEIDALAPLSNHIVANLVPNLGVIALAERLPGQGQVITVGALSGEGPSGFTNPFGGNVPNPVSRFDISVEWPASATHFHLDQPGKTHDLLLWVHSRPSAVLRAFFNDTDFFRGVVFNLLVGFALLFLLVEMAALFLGISLSRRVTKAVNQLSEGTRQVISGDFKHRIQVNSTDQLGELTESFNQMTGHLERLLVSEKERERLLAEIEIAREVQSQLYPRGEAPRCGLKLTARCDPARMVSGDYYDYALLEHRRLAFAIGDVAGKGISAALTMATIQAALRAQVSHAKPVMINGCSHVPEIDSADLVSTLNKQVWAHTSPEKYATFFFGIYDEANCSLTYTNAGHLSPLVFRGGEVVPLDTNGTVIGAFPTATYDESCIVMQPNDLLVCYTDGITEPENAYGEMFGEERLIDLVQKHAQASENEIIRVVFEAVRSWTGVPELSDDMTLLLAREVGVQ